MIKKLLAAFILVLLVGILIINVTRISDDDEGRNEVNVTGNTDVEGAAIVSSSKSGLEVGQKAPNFELQTLSGETIKLSDLKGKKVFINFWATWCAPCKEEMPEMQKFYDNHSDELEILAVNVESNPNTARKFMKKRNYSYPILLDTNSKVIQLYNISPIPTTYFVGTDGVIQQPRKLGPMTYDFMEEMLNKLN